MKKGKSKTVFVLALEIAAIVVLHAVKISHNEKIAPNKEVSRTGITPPSDLKTKSVYSLAVFK